jgi:stage II sporulation protein D
MRRISALLALIVVLTGCAGPKRLPPVVVEPVGPSGPGRQPPSLLGVGLLENEPGLEIYAEGPARLVEGQSGRNLLNLAQAGQRVSCERDGQQVVWRQGGRSGRATSVTLRPLDPATRVSQGDFEYRGEFQVICAPRGRGLTLVNAVDLESYLKGVVPWEIGRHPVAKLAALEAQAIAARTYTVAHWGERRARGFDVFASVMDQVYKGAADEDPLCNQAVESTAGLILKSGQHEIQAYYSACCGGVSSNVHEVWARTAQPYLQSAADGPDAAGASFCAGSRYFHWRETWTIGQLEEILQETLPAYLDWLGESPNRAKWAGPAYSPRDGASNARRPGKLWNLEVLSRTSSGRVAHLAVSTDSGVYHVRGDRTRWVLRPASGNPFILRSAFFDVELERDGSRLLRVATRGKGFGHGIGLCQTGALERAGQGQTYDQILAHYYPGATLTLLAPGRNR